MARKRNWCRCEEGGFYDFMRYVMYALVITGAFFALDALLRGNNNSDNLDRYEKLVPGKCEVIDHRHIIISTSENWIGILDPKQKQLLELELPSRTTNTTDFYEDALGPVEHVSTSSSFLVANNEIPEVFVYSARDFKLESAYAQVSQVCSSVDHIKHNSASVYDRYNDRIVMFCSQENYLFVADAKTSTIVQEEHVPTLYESIIDVSDMIFEKDRLLLVGRNTDTNAVIILEYELVTEKDILAGETLGTLRFVEAHALETLSNVLSPKIIQNIYSEHIYISSTQSDWVAEVNLNPEAGLPKVVYIKTDLVGADEMVFEPRGRYLYVTNSEAVGPTPITAYVIDTYDGTLSSESLNLGLQSPTGISIDGSRYLVVISSSLKKSSTAKLNKYGVFDDQTPEFYYFSGTADIIINYEQDCPCTHCRLMVA